MRILRYYRIPFFHQHTAAISDAAVVAAAAAAVLQLPLLQPQLPNLRPLLLLQLHLLQLSQPLQRRKLTTTAV